MKFDSTYHRNYWQKRRQAIIDALGGKCAKCGSSNSLEVDHIDPTQKSFNVNRRYSANQIQKELAKCQLLCYDCHKEKTASENTGFTHGSIYAWMKAKCECETCRLSKRQWHDKRNAKRKQAGVAERDTQLTQNQSPLGD